ncbi:hypothetical protein [Candidatus Rickettsia colombianensi]|uniref:hypothetical protein n=1 Tax=Candidatus Rickettsia colombianensi TaxID=1090944 RepID=UPI001FE61F82|nr:hypothetical protein [Candidatus Rickettsia colombianensi]
MHDLQNLAKPIIEKIVKQKGFNAEIIDQFKFHAIAWLGEFGAEFLKECIENMKTQNLI